MEILPGSTIGILGGGQLGRMTGMAARTLGYDVHILDPDPRSPACAIASRCITARFDDADAAAELARGCSVVTLEIEQIGLGALKAAAAFAPVRPGAAVMEIVQDRRRQKRWLVEHGFPVGPFRDVSSLEECVAAVAALGPSVAKLPTGGYDGRGQARIATPNDAAIAWTDLGERPCIVEQFLEIEAEVSVLIARRPDGRAVTFPPALNSHERGILDWSVLPARIPDALTSEATQMGCAIAEALGIEGLLAIELFVVAGGELLVNELAPRPHNTFHATERACHTSQFEQLVRAVCGLPLGSVELVQPTAVANLLGDLWRGPAAPDFPAALSIPAVRLHLYGKAAARPGRKMGHLSASATTPDEALQHVLEARSRLTP